MEEKEYMIELNKLRKTREEKQQVLKEVIAAAKDIVEASKEGQLKALRTFVYIYAGKIDGQYDRDVGFLKKKYLRR